MIRGTSYTWLSLCLGVCLVACDKSADEIAPEKPTATAPSPAPTAKAAPDSTQTEAKPDEPASAEPATTATGPKVELLEAGKDPKQELRYQLEAGSVEKGLLKQRTQTKMEGLGGALSGLSGGPKLPEMVFTLSIETKKVDADGTAHMSYAYTSATIGKSNLPAASLAQMKKGLAELTKVKGTQVMTDRGFVVKAELDSSAVTDPQMKQLLGTMDKSVQQMAAPLPKEPVGKGAKWKVTSKVGLMGASLNQIAHYKLKKINGNELVLDVKVEQKAGGSSFSPPGLPPGANVDLKKLTSSGKGSTVLTLDRLLPTTNMKVNTLTDVTTSALGQAIEMSMSSTVTMSIEPAK